MIGAEAAEAAYRRALELDPQQAGARMALADLLLADGRRAEAAGELRAALEQRPSDPVLLNNLAWLLATDPRPAPGAAAEAVALAERATEASPDAESYDTLAAALASAGRFEEARTAALRALNYARERGEDASAEAIGARVRDYAAGRRHVEEAVSRMAPPAQ